MAFIEPREGIVLNDFLHPLLPGPFDLSNYIFLATYATTILCIIFVLKRGLYISAVVFFSYGLLLLCRSLSILIFPLAPPMDMLPLNDPFVRFFNADNVTYTKDLFFSGHAASLFFYYFLANKKWLKNLFLSVALLVVAAISVQRVHYTIDILGGVIAAWFCYSLVQFFAKKWRAYFVWPVFHKELVSKHSLG